VTLIRLNSSVIEEKLVRVSERNRQMVIISWENLPNTGRRVVQAGSRETGTSYKTVSAFNAKRNRSEKPLFEENNPVKPATRYSAPSPSAIGNRLSLHRSSHAIADLAIYLKCRASGREGINDNGNEGKGHMTR
jgi:hypothetical protein